MHGRSAAGGSVDGLLAGTTILVVEDEPDLRELLAETFAHHGAHVCAAGTAEEALLALDGVKADVLVADIGLPGIDGIELIRLLRARAPHRGGSLPAVALTGYARPEDRNEVLEAGYQLHVTKPFDGARLVAAVVSLIVTRVGHSVR